MEFFAGGGKKSTAIDSKGEDQMNEELEIVLNELEEEVDLLNLLVNVQEWTPPTRPKELIHHTTTLT